MELTRARAERPPAPAKVKVLAVADQLFYSEGIHTVGVDKIIAAAHVTKATFYKHYRSKDLLIVAYVRGRDAQARAFLAEQTRKLGDPAAVLRALADAIIVEATREGFHGCPYINAAAQFSDAAHPVRVAVSEHRTWYRQTLVDLLTAMGHPRPAEGADDLLLARDGALLRRKCRGSSGSERRAEARVRTDSRRSVTYSETRSSSSIWARVNRMPAAAIIAST